MSRITPFQAIQLTQTLQRFSGKGGGGFDPLGKLRSATGLDDIRVDTNEAGESSVGVGKYLTDKVYLEVEKGKGEASGAANIEVELTPSISLESKIGQDAQGGAGIFWSRDY
jgi:translocation and assembly module TamB